jgi:hypothetical protein
MISAGFEAKQITMTADYYYKFTELEGSVSDVLKESVRRVAITNIYVEYILKLTLKLSKIDSKFPLVRNISLKFDDYEIYESSGIYLRNVLDFYEQVRVDYIKFGAKQINT